MSDKRDDGGPAFPVLIQWDHATNKKGGAQVGATTGWHEGLSLRDYLAAKAMPQLMHSIDQSSAAEVRDDIAKARVTGAYALVALRAYELADAMLAERAR